MNDFPQTASLPPEAYWQPEWLERERQSAFHNNWIYACLTDDLAAHNDYVSLTVGGLPVVVRNMQGKLVAFRNICSHRHSQIHPVGCGNDMFRCPYHGWTYNADGVPIGIPDNENSFKFDAEAKRARALDPVILEKCGRFLFVRIAKTGPSLAEWLGIYAAKLEHISNSFPQTYATRQTSWACNWKSGVEIALEGYHAPFVHPQTFAQHLGAEEVPDEAPANKHEKIEAPEDFPTRFEYAGLHAATYSPLSSESTNDLRTVARRLRLPRAEGMRGYEHFFIFPNLQISVNDALNVGIMRYEPVAPDLTQTTCRLMVGTPGDAKLLDGVMWRAVMKSWDDWNESVLAEDRLACERTQTSIRYAQRHAVLGQAEERVAFFQTTLDQQVLSQ